MADAIWNDRYILSNMTSEKLYAKSPLTTGVSGTSAYIGLEPSATYNETVLWENTAWLGKDVNPGTNSAVLNESIFNFDYVKVYASRTVLTAGAIPSTIVNEYETNVVSGQSGQCLLHGFFVTQSNTPFNAWTLLKFNNGTGISEVSGGQKPLTGTIDSSKIYYHPYKIIGINRKEV